MAHFVISRVFLVYVHEGKLIYSPEYIKQDNWVDTIEDWVITTQMVTARYTSLISSEIREKEIDRWKEGGEYYLLYCINKFCKSLHE